MDNADIDDYSVEDILKIFNLKNPTVYQVSDVANAIIARMKMEGGSAATIKFFEDARDKVIHALNYGDEDNDTDTDTDTDADSENHVYNDDDSLNRAKEVINKETPSITQTHNIGILKGKINPSQRNIIKRHIFINSKFRENILPYDASINTSVSFNTNYRLDLSEPLTNVISIKVNMVSIPKSWYVFDKHLGNTAYKIGDDEEIKYITSNNYENISDLLNKNSPLNEYFEVIDNKVQYSKTDDSKIILYDKSFPDTYIDNNLAWFFGYRRDIDSNGQIVISNSNPKAEVEPYFYGSQNFFLLVDDYNNNRLNSNIVSIGRLENKLSMPSYYTKADTDCDVSSVEVPTSGLGGNIQEKNVTLYNDNNFPRKLTRSQIYSLNEIIINSKKPNLRLPEINTKNVLAILPIEFNDNNKNLVLTGDTLQISERTYFGPVTIDKLHVKLIDDRGFLVNIQDHPWCFNLEVEQLYQY
tara:strand:+ start:125 stop:1537 length:1413 start_codon:yes stop_codon:yes gene_type:complete